MSRKFGFGNNKQTKDIRTQTADIDKSYSFWNLHDFEWSSLVVVYLMVTYS